ncbi:hypothetical protein [Paenibacillus methanolicus]|uniref:Uncharacterized protein n=1 Tax=Paenibacillus methanolicus TaxID=582686 RepID=A0A5S5C068_9BACL|nr:hypothetical protein [Paenibacillus methanolicus]TYP72008.1 hypothetical protein BCM02_109287 [Paenibacillus methanolicus]
MRTRKMVAMLAFVVAIAVSTPVAMSYMDYRQTRVANGHADAFVQHLQTAVQEKRTFRMTEVADFAWDRMYMFQPYTPRDVMEQTVGSTWNTSDSYLGYLIDQTSVGDHPLIYDHLHKLVFVKDDQVVLDLTLDRITADFTESREMVERGDAWFAVERKDELDGYGQPIEKKRIMIRNASE